MIVTITEYRELAEDADGNKMPMGAFRLASQSRTADGAFAALNEQTTFIRVATDTAIHIDPLGGAVSSADELMPGGSIDFFKVEGGAEISILTAA